MIASIIIFIGCVCTTVILNVKMRNQKIDKSEIHEVVCYVTSVEKTKVKVNGMDSSEFYKVLAEYDGKEQIIHNASHYDRFSEGSTAKVLEYKGKLYANMEGIQSSTTLSYIYFGFLFGSFAMIFVMTNAISKYRKSKWE